MTIRRAKVGVPALLCVLILASSAAAQRAWETPGEADARRARALAQSGRCYEALAYYDRAIVQRQRDPFLRRDRALCHDELGHPLPAIEDYRAYLAMAPAAPDAAPIRARLEELETAHVEATEPPPDPSPPEQADGGDGAANGGAEDEQTEEGEVARLPSSGWLLGAHLGGRDWSSDGMRGLTFSFGLTVGYAYAPFAEVDLRATLLRTNDDNAKGFGVSAVHAWKLGLDEERRGELLFALGGGFETQRDELRRTQNFFFGRLTPSIRWSIHPAVALQGGPELGAGFLPVPKEVRDLEPDAKTRFALYYGLHVELLWELSHRESS